MKEQTDNPSVVDGCSEMMIGFALALLICLLISLCSCSPKKEMVKEYVEQPVIVTQEHHTENVRVDIVRDTIRQRDSIYYFVKGDTTIIERWHYLQGTTNIAKVDTLHIYDSVPYPVVTERTVTETVEVEKPLNWWQKALIAIGGLALIAIGLMVTYKIGKRT